MGRSSSIDPAGIDQCLVEFFLQHQPGELNPRCEEQEADYPTDILHQIRRIGKGSGALLIGLERTARTGKRRRTAAAFCYNLGN